MNKYFKHVPDGYVVYYGPVIQLNNDEWQSVFERMMSKILNAAKLLIPKGETFSLEQTIQAVKSSNMLSVKDVLKSLNALLLLDSKTEMVMVGDVNVFLPINCDVVTVEGTLKDPVSGLVLDQDSLVLIEDLKDDMTRYLEGS
jgi:hypothetical protein